MWFELTTNIRNEVVGLLRRSSYRSTASPDGSHERSFDDAVRFLLRIVEDTHQPLPVKICRGHNPRKSLRVRIMDLINITRAQAEQATRLEDGFVKRIVERVIFSPRHAERFQFEVRLCPQPGEHAGKLHPTETLLRHPEGREEEVRDERKPCRSTR